jgi:hypothetical protein
MTEQTAESVEKVLRDELARGDAVVATARPLLRHLLTCGDSGLFSDEMIARVRGMVLDLAGQLLMARADVAEAGDRQAYVADRIDGLEGALCEDTELLAHLHALALEAHLLERLQDEGAVDAVLTPMIGERLALRDAEAAELAMAVLAAQARFQQHCRRMELPLGELPGEHFHRVLELARVQAGEDRAHAETAEALLREGYREAAGRLGLMARLVFGLGPDAAKALRIDQAGVSVFASALSAASGQDRDRVVLSLGERPAMRLGLSLRAAGLEPRATVAQLLQLHPGISLPAGFEAIHPDRAAALLASPVPQVGA